MQYTYGSLTIDIKETVNFLSDSVFLILLTCNLKAFISSECEKRVKSSKFFTLNWFLLWSVCIIQAYYLSVFAIYSFCRTHCFHRISMGAIDSGICTRSIVKESIIVIVEEVYVFWIVLIVIKSSMFARVYILKRIKCFIGFNRHPRCRKTYSSFSQNISTKKLLHSQSHP